MTKTLTFAVVHFAVAFAVGTLLTGSFVIGGLLALIEPACNTVAYHFHEKAWARWGKRRRGGGAPAASAAVQAGCPAAAA
jgi:uncharacterized membrane protein